MFCIALTGCELTRSLQVSPANQSQVEYHGGVPLLTSVKRHGVAVALLTPQFANRIGQLPSFRIWVFNRGTKSLDFSPANVSVFSGETPVKIYTYEEMQKRISHEASMMVFAAALNGAGRAMQAGAPSQTYSYGTANAYSSGGYATGSYSGTSTTWNPAAAAMAQTQINAQTQNQVALIAANRDAQISGASTILRRDTVLPGQTASAEIELHSESIKTGKPLILRVTLDGDSYDFAFEAAQ